MQAYIYCVATWFPSGKGHFSEGEDREGAPMRTISLTMSLLASVFASPVRRPNAGPLIIFIATPLFNETG